MAVAIVQLVVLLGALTLNIYVAIDARATPDEAFRAVGRSRGRWLALSLFGAFLALFGIGTAVYYLVRVRPALRRELAARGLTHEVSARAKLTRYVLPALALAGGVVLSAHSSGHG